MKEPLFDCIAYDADDTLWAHEHADPTPAERERFFEIEHLGLLPGLVEGLEGREA